MSTTTQRKGEHGFAILTVDDYGVPRLLYDGWEVSFTRGQYDNVPLLFIDTARMDGTGGLEQDTDGPRCRIMLNDEPLWENPPFSLPDDPALLDPDDRPRD